MNYRWYITNGMGEYAHSTSQYEGRLNAVEFFQTLMIAADSWPTKEDALEQLAEWHSAGIIPDGCEVVSGDDL